MPSTVLQDVVALVVASDAVHNAKSAITNRLKSNGAKVVTRLSREVSHVVFERKRSQRTADKDEEMAKITDLYNKLEAVSCAEPFTYCYTVSQ